MCLIGRVFFRENNSRPKPQKSTTLSERQRLVATKHLVTYIVHAITFLTTSTYIHLAWKQRWFDPPFILRHSKLLYSEVISESPAIHLCIERPAPWHYKSNKIPSNYGRIFFLTKNWSSSSGWSEQLYVLTGTGRQYNFNLVVRSFVRSEKAVTLGMYVWAPIQGALMQHICLIKSRYLFFFFLFSIPVYYTHLGASCGGTRDRADWHTSIDRYQRI